MKQIAISTGLTLFSAWALLSCAHDANAGQTKPEICKKLSGRVGVYLVTGGQATPLHFGEQSAKWSGNSLLYFVVAENDGRPETVDHFRVLTKTSVRKRKRELEVGLDRSAANSPCNSKLLGLFNRYGSEKHRATTVDSYNKRLNPKFKDIDNNLNTWHFQWNAAQTRQADAQCDHTSDYTPSFDDAEGDETPGSGFIGAAVAANVVPADAATSGIESVRMVLVHRKEEESACLAVGLSAIAKPMLTSIQHLRFRNKKARFSGSGITIKWLP